MASIQVKTQAELDAALKALKPGQIIECVGSGYFEISNSSQVTAYGSSQVRASNSSQVTAYDSSQVTAYDSSQVTAYGSSQVTAYGSSQVRAYGSSQVRASNSSQVTASSSSQVTAYGSSQVTAYDSSQVRASGSSQVRAYGSSQVRAYGSSQVRASNSSQVTAYGSSQVTASKYVAVTVDKASSRAKVQGGVLIEVPAILSAVDWCEYHGVEVVDGIATLFKAVDDDYSTGYARQAGIAYTPGSSPAAPDWKATPECGGGLHFTARPDGGLRYNERATRFVACPVAVKDLRKPRATDSMPDKIKAKRVSGPIVEVDIMGNPVKAAAA